MWGITRGETPGVEEWTLIATAGNEAQRSDRIAPPSDFPLLSGHCADALFPAAISVTEVVAQTVFTTTEPITVSLPQAAEICEITSAAEPTNDIRLAIHPPHALQLPTASTPRDMHHFYWAAYDSLRAQDTPPQIAQTSSRQQKITEFLFAEEHAEEDFAAAEAGFFQLKPIHGDIKI